MALITIDGVVMPEPVHYSIPMGDMDSSDSTYSESGIRFRNRIRQGIIKLDLGWRVSGNDACTLLAAIMPSKVSVKYFDPRSNTFELADMMVEDRSCDFITFDNGSNPHSNMWEISFSLVQY